MEGNEFMKILIYDDEARFSNRLRENLLKLAIKGDDFQVSAITEDDFHETMNTLLQRQREFRISGTWTGGKVISDDASVFIIDFDLINSKAGAFLTSEHVSYLVRCFSTCGLIIGLNLPIYRDNGFDLTLKGHPESFADLNIGGKQLANPGLWVPNFSGFRPWHWPLLPIYLEQYYKKVIDVKKSLATNKPVWEVIGFDKKVFDLLPRSIAQFLGRGINLAEVGFREFVLNSGNGLHPKDGSTANDDVVARVGAARIAKWMERVVLLGQDIIVDGPHLISRFPSLVKGNVKDINSWNNSAFIASHDTLGINTDIIEPFRLKNDCWVSRPVWFWDGVRECQGIMEVNSPWKSYKPNWAFCEDASRFYKDGYQEFIADTESPYRRRYIRTFKGVDYRPQLRLSL
jgi:hypothetical protein